MSVYWQFSSSSVLVLLLGILTVFTACRSIQASTDKIPSLVLEPQTTPPLAAKPTAQRKSALNATPTTLPKSLAFRKSLSVQEKNKSCHDEVASPNEPIRIGVLAPVSESTAYQAGLAMMTAADMASAEINARGGVLNRPLQLVSVDTKGDPITAAQSVVKVILKDCVVGLIGGYHSHVALEIKEIAHDYEVPIIFAESYHDQITADHYPEVFRISPSSNMVNKQFAQWFAHIGDFNNDGEITVTVIAEDTPGSIERLKEFAGVLSEYNISLSPFLVDLPANEFSSIIARLVSLYQMPDFVFVWFNGESGYSLLQQLDEAAIGPTNQTIIITRQPALNHELFWNKLPDGINMVVTKIGPWYSTVTEMGRAFAANYQENQGFWPESYAFGTHDAVWLMADAVHRAETTEAVAVIAALESTYTELAAGRYCFTQMNANDLDAGNNGFCSSQYDSTWHQWPDAQILILQYTLPNQSSHAMEVIWPPLHQSADFSVYFE